MQTIIKALREVDARPYQERYFTTAKAEAQEALQGRTHYVDDSTLHYFAARITSARPILDGLFFEIVESSATNIDNTARGFRVVVFDVFGETVYRPNLQDMKRTSEAARRAYANDFNIDPAAHYAEKLQSLARRRASEAEALTKAAQMVAA